MECKEKLLKDNFLNVTKSDLNAEQDIIFTERFTFCWNVGWFADFPFLSVWLIYKIQWMTDILMKHICWMPND